MNHFHLDPKICPQTFVLPQEKTRVEMVISDKKKSVPRKEVPSLCDEGKSKNAEQCLMKQKNPEVQKKTQNSESS